MEEMDGTLQRWPSELLAGSKAMKRCGERNVLMEARTQHGNQQEKWEVCVNCRATSSLG